jgi:4-hydroxybenzoate polyprenyltransferase
LESRPELWALYVDKFWQESMAAGICCWCCLFSSALCLCICVSVLCVSAYMMVLYKNVDRETDRAAADSSRQHSSRQQQTAADSRQSRGADRGVSQLKY